MKRTQTRPAGGLGRALGARGWSDNGERYVVSYVDGTGQRRDFGFTDSLDEARGWVKKIKEHPMWDAAKIRERRAAA